MIRAVFFDIGNTLFFYNYPFLSELLKERFEIDRHPKELEAVHYSLGEVIGRKVAERKGHNALVREVYSMWFAELDIDADRIPRIVDSIESHPFPHLFWARPGEGVRELLDWFRGRGIRMGVISNAEGQIKRLIDHVGMNDFFDVILDSHEVGIEKPDARIFERGLEGLGVAPNESVHVGDLVEADVKGARKAGMIPVLVDRENRYPDIDCARIRSVRELTGLTLFKSYR